MKIKQHLIIRNPDHFLRGEYDGCFTLFGHESAVPEWIDCGEIEIDVNIDRTEAIAKTVEAIDAEETRIRAESTAKINMLEGRKNELLAITYQAEEI